MQAGRLVLIAAALAVYLSSLAYALRSLREPPEMVDRGRETPEAEPARRVALLGLMAALAAMMQVSAVFWPGGGHILAAVSSLPVAAGTMLLPGGALPMTLAVAGILASVYVHEAIIFLFTTAPVGLMAAWAARTSRPVWLRLLLPGLTVSSGILLMVHAAGLPALGDAVAGLAPFPATAVYITFGFTYTWFWTWLVGRLGQRLLPLEAGTRAKRC